MRSRFYLYASGAKSDIRDLHNALKVPGSGTKAFSKESVIGKAHPGEQWMWYSPYINCSSEFPEDEMLGFLRNNNALLQQLKAHRSDLHELVGMIVCELDKDERPHGYSISSELMRLLAEAGASLEIDMCQTVTKSSSDG